MVDICFDPISSTRVEFPSISGNNVPIGGMEASIFAALGTQLKLLGNVASELGVSSHTTTDNLGIILQSLNASTAALAKGTARQYATPEVALATKKKRSKTGNDSGGTNVGNVPPKSKIAVAETSETNAPVMLRRSSRSHTSFDDHAVPSKRSRITSFVDTADPNALPKRRLIKAIVSHWAFDAFVGILISFNALTIGWETSNKVQGQPVPFWIFVLERIFLLSYIFELGMRLYAFGIPVFASNWVKFDAFLVTCGIINELLSFIGDADAKGGARELLEKAMLVRLCRLARLARVVRLMVQFRVLYMLLQGLVESLQTLMWTFVVIFILLYGFAVLGLELIPDPKTSDRYQEVVETNFNSLQSAVLTLLQGLTLDSLGSIYRPLLLERPELYVYFLPFILIVSIALMNLVTAIMVEHALEQAADDKELQEAYQKYAKKRMITELEKVFNLLDVDESGSLTLDEVLSSEPDVQDRLFKVMNTQDINEIKEIFATLDYDGSGHLAIHEFCEGLTRIQDGKPIEISCIMKQCRDIMHTQKSFPGIQYAPVAREQTGLSWEPSQMTV